MLECVRACAGSRPIELLRKESLAGMPPPQAFRILSHSYGVVLPITSLAFPPLPLSDALPESPVNYGPTPAAQTPWLQLLLYSSVGVGPASLVLAAGQQLRRLPAELDAGGATHALLWPWDAAAVRAQVGAALPCRRHWCAQLCLADAAGSLGQRAWTLGTRLMLSQGGCCLDVMSHLHLN